MKIIGVAIDSAPSTPPFQPQTRTAMDPKQTVPVSMNTSRWIIKRVVPVKLQSEWKVPSTLVEKAYLWISYGSSFGCKADDIFVL